MAKNRALVDALNDALASELGAIVAYIAYSAQVTGPARDAIRELLLKEVPDETRHAQFFADKVVALGAMPATTPKTVAATASPREILETVYAMEKESIESYKQALKLAEEAGDVGLRVQIENIIADETSHMEECEKILRGWK